MSRTIYMGTTGISPERTAAEIAAELQRMKVAHVSHEYINGRVVAMRFCIKTPTGEECWYRLPIRVAHVAEAMRRITGRKPDPEQAERTAWRQVLRWVQAQLALIEVDASTPFEVFLPYMHVGVENQTMAELFSEQKGVPLLPMLD